MLEMIQLQDIKNNYYSKSEGDSTFIPKSENIIVHDMAVEGSTITIDSSVSSSHSLNVTGAVTINFTGFTVGKRSGVLLDLKNGGSFGITFGGGTFNWIFNDGTFKSSIAAAGYILKSDATSDFVLVWSDDGGANLYGRVAR